MTAGGKHRAPRKPWTRARLGVAVASAVVLLAGAGGAIAFAATRGPSPAARKARAAEVAHQHAVAEAAALRSAQDALLAGLEVTPADSTTGVPLDSKVTVAVGSGTLTSVTVTSASGVPLAGGPAPSTGGWESTGSLLPSTTYTVKVSLSGNGVTANRTTTFATLTPTTILEASAFPSNGMTVGVGQPVVLGFNHDVTSVEAQKAIISRLTVLMSQPVPGAWYWFSSHELHFRPQSFWPAQEQVKVVGDIGGIDVGDGRWTAGSIIDSFSVGDARISYANLAAEVMTVTLNGKTVYTFPISGGRPQYPTMDGTHIVMDRQSVVHMVSSTVGIPVNSPNGYDELVYDDVHISDSGEYVHAAPWSVGSQGVTNVSHGCINLSTAHAKSFYDFSRVGDLVVVTGSSRPAAWGDHGVMDWSGPVWSHWTPGTVLPLVASPATTTTTSTTAALPTAPPTTSAAQASSTTRPVGTTTTTRPSTPTT